MRDGRQPRGHMALGMPTHAIDYHPACWLVPGVPPDGAMRLDHATNCARIAERGKLDFVFLADTGAVPLKVLPGCAAHFVDLVVPELQRRGLFRTEHDGATLRENLGLPPIAGRMGAA